MDDWLRGDMGERGRTFPAGVKGTTHPQQMKPTGRLLRGGTREAGGSVAETQVITPYKAPQRAQAYGDTLYLVSKHKILARADGSSITDKPESTWMTGYGVI